MRIATLTFSKVNNRGALLQAHALQRVLTEMGHSAEVIGIELPSKRLSWKGELHRMVFEWSLRSFRRKFINYSRRTYRSAQELKRLAPRADAYVVGSDQVWNRSITKNFGSSAFFLDFAPEDARRVAYAVSLGEDKWTDRPQRFIDLAAQFDAVSVREQTSVPVLAANLMVDNARCVVDPVLLLTDFNHILTGSYATARQPAIVKMLLHVKPMADDVVEAGRRLLDCERVEVIGLEKNHKDYNSNPFVGIEGWLAMLRDSRLVVTNSFHCMAASIVLQKDFVVVPPYPGRGNRMQSLLEKLGIPERYVDDGSDISLIESVVAKPIDYAEINARLKPLREASLQFLKDSL